MREFLAKPINAELKRIEIVNTRRLDFQNPDLNYLKEVCDNALFVFLGLAIGFIPLYLYDKYDDYLLYKSKKLASTIDQSLKNNDHKYRLISGFEDGAKSKIYLDENIFKSPSLLDFFTVNVDYKTKFASYPKEGLMSNFLNNIPVKAPHCFLRYFEHIFQHHEPNINTIFDIKVTKFSRKGKIDCYLFEIVNKTEVD